VTALQPASDAPVLDDEDLPPVVTTRRTRKGSRPRILVASGLAVAAIAFVLWQGLGGATVYFRTADEAVAQRSSLGTKRFRLEGVVTAGTIQQSAGSLRFSVRGDKGAVIPVVHTGGQPTGLFRDDIPVVLEGHWAKDGAAYLSDRVIVKHSESYRAANPDRVRSYSDTQKGS
jgi:cytochrome c-type biogenesis protein CcmE